MKQPYPGLQQKTQQKHFSTPSVHACLLRLPGGNALFCDPRSGGDFQAISDLSKFTDIFGFNPTEEGGLKKPLRAGPNHSPLQSAQHSPL